MKAPLTLERVAAEATMPGLADRRSLAVQVRLHWKRHEWMRQRTLCRLCDDAVRHLVVPRQPQELYEWVLDQYAYEDLPYAPGKAYFCYSVLQLLERSLR